MNYCLLIIFSYVRAVYTLYVVPEHLPRMYFDGSEWRKLKPERNVTSSKQRPTLPLLLEMFSSTVTTESPDKIIIDLDGTTPSNTLDSISFNWSLPANNYVENIFMPKPDKNETTSTSTEEPNVRKNFSNITDYHIIISKQANNTKTVKNTTEETTATNTTLLTNPADWLKVVVELSKTLQELIKKQKLINNADVVHTTVTNTLKTTTKTHKTTTKTHKTTTTKKSHRNSNDHRRNNMENIDDLLALFTEGIEIDNGSDTSDDLNKSNRKFLKAIRVPKSKLRHSTDDESDTDEDKNRDTDSADVDSDGEEETRLILVEDDRGSEYKSKKEI